MAAIILGHRWRVQPPVGVPLDPTHPLVRGLWSAYGCGNPLRPQNLIDRSATDDVGATGNVIRRFGGTYTAIGRDGGRYQHTRATTIASSGAISHFTIGVH